MREQGEFGVSPFKRVFGSWNNALRAAGFGTNHQNNIPKEGLLNELERFDEEHDGTPTYEGMADEGRFSPTAYERAFGTWNDALREGGFALNHRNNLSTAELLDELSRLESELGRPPTSEDMREFGKHDPVPYQRAFGTWNGALREAGFEPRSRDTIPDTELLDEIGRLYEEIGRPPFKDEMNERGKFSEIAYVRAFGSWNDALREGGYETFAERQDPPAAGYGSTWQTKRKERLERDDYRCVACGMANEEHCSTYGRSIEVHHVVPKEQFRDESGELDEENAHTLTNLRALCKPCHRQAEAIAPLLPSGIGQPTVD
jgi:hypothetical protein